MWVEAQIVRYDDALDILDFGSCYHATTLLDWSSQRCIISASGYRALLTRAGARHTAFAPPWTPDACASMPPPETVSSSHTSTPAVSRLHHPPSEISCLSCLPFFLQRPPRSCPPTSLFPQNLNRLCPALHPPIPPGARPASTDAGSNATSSILFRPMSEEASHLRVRANLHKGLV